MIHDDTIKYLRRNVERDKRTFVFNYAELHRAFPAAKHVGEGVEMLAATLGAGWCKSRHLPNVLVRTCEKRPALDRLDDLVRSQEVAR